MKISVVPFCAVATVFSLWGCAFFMQQPSGAPQEQKKTPKLERKTQTFTGKVVMAEGAYRFSLLKDPDTLLRLTRGRRVSDFESGQINLRKYYEKTISVNGTREGDWIYGADIVGQWLQPGEPTGPNINAPKLPNQ